MDENTKRENEAAQAALEAEKARYSPHKGGSRPTEPAADPAEPKPVVEPASKPAEPVPKPAEETPAEPEPKPVVEDEPVVAADADPEPKPKKFIPIDQYKDEKKKHDAELATRDARILELEGIASKKEGSAAQDKLIEQFAEKHNVDKDQVSDLLEIVKAAGPALSEEDKKKIDAGASVALQQEEVTYFDKEFETTLPAIKEAYPAASEAELKKIKDHLWNVGHTAAYAEKDLDYVLFKTKKDVDKIIGSASAPKVEETPAEPGRRSGIEAATPGKGKIQTLSGKDFNGKTDFSSLTGLPDEEVSRVRKEMNAATRIAFDLARAPSEGVEVNRGGRIIHLKS